MKVWVFPRKGAYTGPLYDEIENAGVNTLESDLSFNWLLKKTSKGDILHVHWPSYRYLREGSKFSLIFSLIKFCLFFLLLKVKRVRLWWTAHNLMPHDRCTIKILDVWARHLIIYLSEKIFVHGTAAQSVLVAHFPMVKKKVITIPHGHWIEYYGKRENKQQARIKLGLNEKSTTFLLFGQLKSYKNLEGLIVAFKRLNKQEYTLLIAGKFSDQDYQQKIESLAKNNSNIIVAAKFIEDPEVPTYLAACDAMFMPYTEILTSGTAMLSMSYGRPIISINKGYLSDVINEKSGMLLADIETSSLVKAMTEFKNRQWDDDEIVKHVSQFTFTDAANTFIKALDVQNGVTSQ